MTAIESVTVIVTVPEAIMAIAIVITVESSIVIEMALQTGIVTELVPVALIKVMVIG